MCPYPGTVTDSSGSSRKNKGAKASEKGRKPIELAVLIRKMKKYGQHLKHDDPELRKKGK